MHQFVLIDEGDTTSTDIFRPNSTKNYEYVEIFHVQLRTSDDDP